MAKSILNFRDHPRQMDAFFNDVKYSITMFATNPGFTVNALAALALGIRSTTAIFSIVNGHGLRLRRKLATAGIGEAWLA